MAEFKASDVKQLRERTGLGMMECKKALAEADGDIEAAIEQLRKTSGMKAAKKAGRTAADGAVSIRVADDLSRAAIVEVNSETDFVARDEGFRAFVADVVQAAFAREDNDIQALMDSGLEDSRQALVQKIGENISVRRMDTLAGDVVSGYVHGNDKIAVLVALSGGDEVLAKDVAMHVAAVNPAVARPEDMPGEVLEKEREIYLAQARDSGKPADIIEKMVEGRVRKFIAESSLVEQPFVKDPDIRVGALLKNAGADILGFIRYEVGEGIEKDEVDFAAEVAAQAGKAD